MMRKLLLLMIACCLSMTLAAQQSDFQKAVAHFKGVKGATATVTKSQHKKALAKEVTTTGSAQISKPDMVSISTNNGQDKLVMKGNKFTMTMRGREHATDSQKNPQFATFQKVLTSIINGGSEDISKLPEVTISTSGNNLSIVIIPEVDGKKKRRLMFTSMVLVIDRTSSAFRLLRMIERDGSYTDYEFRDFKFN